MSQRWTTLLAYTAVVLEGILMLAESFCIKPKFWYFCEFLGFCEITVLYFWLVDILPPKPTFSTDPHTLPFNVYFFPRDIFFRARDNFLKNARDSEKTPVTIFVYVFFYQYIFLPKMYNFISIAMGFSNFISMYNISIFEFSNFYQFTLISIVILTIFISRTLSVFLQIL